MPPRFPRRRDIPAVPVTDVNVRPVPFLRPFEWMAPAFKTFREQPLPSSYLTEAVPGFDVFGTSRVEEYQVERVLAAAGLNEVTGSKVDADKYRMYLSVSFFHTHVANLLLQAGRVVPDPTLGFPFMAFQSQFIGTPNQIYAIANVIIPPEGRFAVQSQGIGVGAQLQINTLFIEYFIGEPHGLGGLSFSQVV